MRSHALCCFPKKKYPSYPSYLYVLCPQIALVAIIPSQFDLFIVCSLWYLKKGKVSNQICHSVISESTEDPTVLGSTRSNCPWTPPFSMHKMAVCEISYVLHHPLLCLQPNTLLHMVAAASTGHCGAILPDRKSCKLQDSNKRANNKEVKLWGDAGNEGDLRALDRQTAWIILFNNNTTHCCSCWGKLGGNHTMRICVQMLMPDSSSCGRCLFFVGHYNLSHVDKDKNTEALDFRSNNWRMPISSRDEIDKDEIVF